jgi:hypothetical protein
VGLVHVNPQSESAPVEIDWLERFERVATNLRRHLTDIIGSDTGSLREKRLIETWQIDRNLAGRLVRSLRTSTELAMLAELPAPEGLRLFLHAAQRIGSAQLHLDGAASAISEWESIIHAYPGKRRGISQRLAAMSTDGRSRADLAARRGMFRFASEFLGYSVRHTTSTMILSPSQTEGRLDGVMVFGKYGLVRLREDGAPISVMGIRAGPAAPQCDFLPIDPHAQGDRADAALLRANCTGVDRLELVRTPANAIELRLAQASPPVNHEVDLVCGQRVPAIMLGQRTQSTRFEWYEALSRIPSQRVTLDFILHRDVFAGVTPIVTARLFGPTQPVVPTSPVPASDAVRISAVPERIEPGLATLGLHDVPGYPRMVANVMDQLHLDRRDFSGWRVQLAFPMLMASTIVWFELR